ncbi:MULTISPECIES: pyrroline-5-carboxylate reductase [unclassified Acinetobacter]|uniref:pyrroline-5-carboxylate reductase n=1 Tax=unclassified Acinetobacter TaxID=196816 RepID=UPI0035BB3773
MTDLQQHRMLFIGGGNMAQALIGGLLAQGVASSQFMVADPSTAIQQYFNEKNIATTSQATDFIDQADVIVLAIKPQVLAQVLSPLHGKLKQQLIISVVAGAKISSIAQLLGDHQRIVRVMPNTPALLQMGASGAFAADAVSESEKQLTLQILQATGLAIWVQNEQQIDAVTALSGSGPAYFFYMIEAMIKAGTDLGLDIETAKALALQTATGASMMAQQSEFDVAELRRRVTSPNGTTQAAIESFDQQHIAQHIAQGMQAAYQRSGELAVELEQQFKADLG